MRLVTMLFFGAMLGFAGSWSGSLVDSNCYASEERNANKNTTTVDRDMSAVVRYCSPNAHMRDFAIVLPDWDGHKLDSAGNAKAAELVRNTRRRSVFEVTLTGDLTKDSIAVTSISLNP